MRNGELHHGVGKRFARGRMSSGLPDGYKRGSEKLAWFVLKETIIIAHRAERAV